MFHELYNYIYKTTSYDVQIIFICIYILNFNQFVSDKREQISIKYMLNKVKAKEKCVG